MTFEEFKDQVAKDMFESSFLEFEEVYYDDEVKMAVLYTKAAELYARSVAAQAWEEGYNIGYGKGKPINPYKP